MIMKRPKRDPAELVQLAATLHSATTGILICLTKTLEESGAMRAEDFEAVVRIMAERTAKKKSSDAASLMFDFADQLSRAPRRTQ